MLVTGTTKKNRDTKSLFINTMKKYTDTSLRKLGAVRDTNTNKGHESHHTTTTTGGTQPVRLPTSFLTSSSPSFVPVYCKEGGICPSVFPWSHQCDAVINIIIPKVIDTPETAHNFGNNRRNEKKVSRIFFKSCLVLLRTLCTHSRLIRIFQFADVAIKVARYYILIANLFSKRNITKTATFNISDELTGYQ